MCHASFLSLWKKFATRYWRFLAGYRVAMHPPLSSVPIASVQLREECEKWKGAARRVTRVFPVFVRGDARERRAQRWAEIEKELVSAGFSFEPAPKGVKSAGMSQPTRLSELGFDVIDKCGRSKEDQMLRCDLVAARGRRSVVVEPKIYEGEGGASEMDGIVRVYVAPSLRFAIAIGRWASLGRAPTACRKRECGLHVIDVAKVKRQIAE